MSAFSLPPFKNQKLWQQAMTHRSFVNEQPSVSEHNERLEFLGDAILTFVSGAYLYARYPGRPEGELTLIRAALVDKPQLCHFAQVLNLGEYLRLGRGADQEGARQSPRLLCSAFEAMIGAYFLDVEQDVSAVSAYVLPMFDTVVNQAVEVGTDAKSQWQEWVQKHLATVPVYQVVESAGPDHKKQFVAEVRAGEVPYGRGEGHSKKVAEKAAAQAALRRVQERLDTTL